MAGKNNQFNYIGEPSDKLRCLICLDVAEDPKQHETCGKIFCAECIKKNGKKPCPSCREESPNFFTDTRAAQEIRDLRLTCSNLDNGCKWHGTMQALDKHLTTCGFEYVSCKYQYVGCDVKMMRKDITKHEEQDDKKHLHLALQRLTITLSNGECLMFKMTDYISKKANKEVFLSDPFFTHTNGYKMCVKVHVDGTGCGQGTHLSVSILLLKGPSDDNLQWPFVGTVIVEILNQIGNYDHYSIKWSYNGSRNSRPGNCYAMERFIPNSLLSKELTNSTLFLKNDSIYFRVLVKFTDSLLWLACGKKMLPELIESCEVIPDNQPLVFKNSELTVSKKNNDRFSRLFLSSHCGYRMRVVIYPNGNGEAKDTHMSIFLYILEGPYDKSLTWPFLGNVKFELLNQLADDHHFRKELVLDQDKNMIVGSSWGYPKFIRQADLQDGDKQYLMNDSLYWRITVSVDSHKPWLTCTNFFSF